MTTSDLVGPASQSFQEHPVSLSHPELFGASTRLGAYNRLKAWLKMSPEEATTASSAFRAAVATLPGDEQARVRAAESDALLHGFSLTDFQRLRHLALTAFSDPAVSAGIADDGIEPPANFAAAMLALSR